MGQQKRIKQLGCAEQALRLAGRRRRLSGVLKQKAPTKMTGACVFLLPCRPITYDSIEHEEI